MHRVRTVALALAAMALPAATAWAVEPANRELIPEARALLKYLEGIYGTRTLSGASGLGNVAWVQEVTGRKPAVVSLDLTGWNSPTWGKTYTPVVERSIANARQWWAEGGILAMQFHWKHPGNPHGTAWVGKHGANPPSGPFDIAAALQSGTEPHRQFMEDLKRHADYLQQLAEARVPVLWRPFHEIDGGWFWWTDRDKPENTAALWRMMFHYLVRERKLHNLIWVYNAALKTAQRKDTPPDEQLAYRRACYPGPEYVDIAGIDIYPSSYYGWAPFQEDAYAKAFELMQQVAPGKMLALCEGAGIPNPDLMAKDGPRWLYCLQWFEGDAAWARKVYTHSHIVTLDELPLLAPGRIAPRVRIVFPADGTIAAGRDVELRAEAGIPEGAIAKVQLLRLPGGWHNWALLQQESQDEAIRNAAVLGEAAAAPYAVTWRKAPAGFHQIIARAIDAKGVAALSNTVKLSVGLENLALGKAVTASSTAKSSATSAAVDGDPFTAWSSEKADPQWVCVDLGEARRVGGVMLLWTKASARAYRVQLAAEPDRWTDVHVEAKSRGGQEVIRFAPAKVRFVRVLGTQRGTDWGGYALYDFGVYESLPEPPQAAMVK